jgi:hypothetical protein
MRARPFRDAFYLLGTIVSLFLVTQAVASANRVIIGSGAGLPGTTGNVVTIALRNEAPVRGIQLELADLPDYLRPDSVWVTGRAYGFISQFNDVGGVLHLIAIAFNYTLPADSGAVVQVNYRVAPDAPLGTKVVLRVSQLMVINGQNQVIEASAEDGVFAIGSPSGVAQEGGHPLSFALLQNYPNPFAPTTGSGGSTAIPFCLPQPETVSLVVYDLLGRKVRTVVAARLGAGKHEVAWDGTDETGQPAPVGVYLYRLQAGGHTASKRLFLVK